MAETIARNSSRWFNLSTTTRPLHELAFPRRLTTHATMPHSHLCTIGRVRKDSTQQNSDSGLQFIAWPRHRERKMSATSRRLQLLCAFDTAKDIVQGTRQAP